MTVKSIIAIDIQDAAFQRYLKTYNQYQASLQRMPGAWKQINQAVKGTLPGFQQLVNAAVAHNVQAKLLLQAQEKADRITKSTADRWKDMARSTKTFATNITDATRSILRWGAIGGVLSGILGIGSLFGLDRLGGMAAAQRRTSLGRGLSYGAQQAFRTAFGQELDVDTVLTHVNTALTNQVSPEAIAFSKAGLNIQGMTTQQATIAAIERAVQFAKTTPVNQLGLRAKVQGFEELGFDEQTLRTYKEMSPQALAKNMQVLMDNLNRLNVDRDTQEKWKDFTRQLDLAGKQIETSLIKVLVPLTPDLEQLSKSVVSLVEAFGEGPLLKESIDGLAKGFARLADIIRPFHLTSVDPRLFGAISGAILGARTGGIYGAVAGAIIGAGLGQAVGDKAADAGLVPGGGGVGGTGFPGAGRSHMGRIASASMASVVAGLVARGFSPEQAAAIAGNLLAESGLRTGAVNKTSGAFGLEQLLGSRKSGFLKFAQETGKSPYDLGAQLDWIKMERTGESIKYGGTDADRRAAYQAALSAYGLAGKTAAFAEKVEVPSKAELAQSMARRQEGASVALKLTVDNRTGGNLSWVAQAPVPLSGFGGLSAQ